MSSDAPVHAQEAGSYTPAPAETNRLINDASKYAEILKNQKPVASDAATGTPNQPGQDQNSSTLQRNPDGSVKLSNTGGASPEQQLGIMQKMTGFESYSINAEPGRGRSAGASFTKSAHLDFSCLRNAEVGRTKSANGVTLLLKACNVANDTAVQTMSVQICTKQKEGGVCGQSDFGQAVTLLRNQYQDIQGIRYGTGCNDTNAACRVTITVTEAVSGNLDSLKEQGRDKLDSQFDESGKANGAAATLNQTYNSQEYTDAFNGQSDIVACNNRQIQQLEAGQPVESCDGSSQVSMSSELSSADCQDNFTCLRQVDKTVEYTKTCRVMPKTTEYRCTYDYPKKTCVRSKNYSYATTTSVSYYTVDKLDKDGKKIGEETIYNTPVVSVSPSDEAPRWAPAQDAKPPYLDSCSEEDYKHADLVGATGWALTDNSYSVTEPFGDEKNGGYVTTDYTINDYERELYLAWTRDQAAYPTGWGKHRISLGCFASPYALDTSPPVSTGQPLDGFKPASGQFGASGQVCVMQDIRAGYSCLQQGMSNTQLVTDPVLGVIDREEQYVLSEPNQASFFGVTTSDFANSCVDRSQGFNEVMDYNSMFLAQRDSGDGDMRFYDGAAPTSCGVCNTPTYGYTCYANPDVKTADTNYKEDPSFQDEADLCQNTELTDCELVSEDNSSGLEGILSDGEISTSGTRTYRCKKSESICVEFERTNSCLNMDNALKLGERFTQPSHFDQEAFSKAVASLGMLSATNQNTSKPGNDEFAIPRIFSGSGLSCSYSTDYFANALYNNCCRASLERPGKDGKLFHSCGFNEVKLAAARRAGYTVEMGDFCSKTRKFPKRCIQRTQTACVFEGLLPKLVQVQGRAQLSQLVFGSQGAQVTEKPISFNYYADNSKIGQWTTPTDINGQRISMWREPGYCRDMGNPSKILAFLTDPANSDAQECSPQITTHVAVCDLQQSGGCPATPQLTDPYEFSPFYDVVRVNPLSNVPTTANRYVLATGGCNPATEACEYKLKVLPPGQGGKSLMTRTLAFPLISANVELEGQQMGLNNLSSLTSSQNEALEQTNLGDYIFRVRPASVVADIRDNTLPPTVEMKLSVDGGATFQTIQVPTAGADQLQVPGTTLSITGGCDLTSNLCKYQIAGEISVQPKPWGGPYSPDCSGFTLAQLSALDFGKMDLSEWTATITGKVKAGSMTSAGTLVSDRAGQFVSQYNSGAQTISVPVSSSGRTEYAVVQPKEGYGPFRVKMRARTSYVIGYEDGPNGAVREKTSPIVKMEVDWGDGTPKQIVPKRTVANQPAQPWWAILFGIEPGETITGEIYEMDHDYASPDQVPSQFGGGSNNIQHNITITMTLENGREETVLSRVQNVWSNYSGTVGLAEGEGGNKATTDTTTIDNSSNRRIQY